MVARFLPLDLPLFEHKHAVLKTFNFFNKKPFFWWDELELTERDYTVPFESANDWTNLAKNNFSELVNYIDQYFPFEHVVYAKLIRANKDVAPHVDNNYVDVDQEKGHRFNLITHAYLQHQHETEPCGYRMLIHGNRNNLYLTDDKFIDKTYCEIPESTDCFVLKTNDSPHGVDKITGDDNRLLLFVIGKLNTYAHARLIETSYEKYQTYSRT